MLWAFTIYSLETGACLAGFYLFFKLLLSRETFHWLNRMLILAATAASFALPVCVVTRYRVLPAALGPAQDAAALPSDTALAEAAAQGPVWWQTAAGVLLLAGAAVTLAAMLRSLWCVRRVLREGRRERLDDGAWLVVAEREIAPFSWGRHIVVSRRDLEENGRAILTHERAHVRLHHSHDLLATDLAGCFQWFNPAMWLLRRELRALHEYEADAAVLDSGVDARTYQLLLIKKAAGERWYSVANSFNHSKLKSRITMMLQKRSSRWAAAKALLVLPLAGVALGAFAETVYVVPDDKGTNKREQKQAESLFLPSESAFGEAKDTKKGARNQEQTTIVVTGGYSDKVAVRGTDAPTGLKPLYIVDGKEVENLDGVDMGRVAGITVLKDATATERYGEGAKDGVIIITTRSAGDTSDGLTVTTPSGGASEVKRTTSGNMERITVVTSPAGSDAAAKPGDDTLLVVGRKGSAQDKTTTTTMTTSIDDSGAVVSSETIRVTGNVTLTEGSQFDDALILIDGKEATSRRLHKLDSEKIEEIRILKGKAAEEAYGEKGARGVVVVTTKKK
ncbi:M56 family metallopeptidase [Alistipes sp.]|uniref:M56 family metallopeptidase n=1 Tax=Alistipes sp. TaxID=1872444 RepID=UPI000EE30EF1|nr:M56 family metallopeptidase [Alistipes sp.]HCN12987.1 peptidase M56 [Alistipes sp.]